MNIRRITSMTMFVSLAVLLLNSIVLYVVPEGRVAFWADWRFLGLSKGQWGEQHTTVGFLFLCAGVLHIYYNWKPIVAYMKNKARQVRVFTVPFNAALALTVIFIVGTYYQVPPMSTIVNISDSFKVAASEKYGEPPYGHAESSSLKMFTKREGLDLNMSLLLLKDAGVIVRGPEETIKEIADNGGKSPQKIYELIKAALLSPVAAPGDSGGPIFPDSPNPGWGNKKLADVCTEYDLKIDGIIQSLAQIGIEAEADLTIKEIAAANELDPMRVFEAFHGIVK